MTPKVVSFRIRRWWDTESKSTIASRIMASNNLQMIEVMLIGRLLHGFAFEPFLYIAVCMPSSCSVVGFRSQLDSYLRIFPANLNSIIVWIAGEVM